MKEKIDALENAGLITLALRRGVLLTGKANGRVNPMTIGWGMIGVEWAKPIFIAYVRQSRFTRTLLEANPEFTVSVPAPDATPEQSERVRQILSVCGTKSGRDIDKISELGLTLTEPDKISVPGIKELPLTLECRVLFSRDQDVANHLEASQLERWYPKGELAGAQGEARDIHTEYYGEIVSAYIEK
jgi:flavin reductase (DIM6/NTAB) family NADH-FMN oxidoreductase RutF